LRYGLLGLAMALSLASQSFAEIIITPGNSPGDEDNITFNGPGTSTVGSVVGSNNGGIDNFFVSFDSSDPLQAPSSGQARVEAVDGFFTDLTFFSSGNLFTSAIFNLNVFNPQGSDNGAGTVTFVIDRVGELPHMEEFDVDGAGENFVTIRAENGQQITAISLTSTSPIVDIRQVRLGGVAELPSSEPADIPEPTSMFLMGSGLSGLVYLARKRRMSAQ
jgi:PEP-CTERM motif